jgi:hypothetical protein
MKWGGKKTSAQLLADSSIDFMFGGLKNEYKWENAMSIFWIYFLRFTQRMHILKNL